MICRRLRVFFRGSKVRCGATGGELARCKSTYASLQLMKAPTAQIREVHDGRCWRVSRLTRTRTENSVELQSDKGGGGEEGAAESGGKMR